MGGDTFAGRLRELREAAGLTQQQLAERAGMQTNTIARLERAEREPAWKTAIALAQALGVSCEDFLQEPADRPPQGRGRPPKAAEAEKVAAPPRTRGRPRKDSAGPSGDKARRPRKKA
jgi:transcriptional regulator with XRE-family HTH domain